MIKNKYPYLEKNLKTNKFYRFKLGLLSAMLGSTTAFSAPVQIDFSGTFWYADGSVYGIPITAGQTFTGSMFYDSSIAATNQYFYYVPSPYKVDLYINGNTVESDGFVGRTGGGLRIDSESVFCPASYLANFCSSASMTLNGVPLPSQAGFYFVFSGTFPTLPQSITDATGAAGYVWTDSSSTGSAGFLINNVAPVPSPAAGWLLGSGLLGLAGVARKRKAT